MCLTSQINVFMATLVLAQLHVEAEPSLAESLTRVVVMEFLHANVTRILVQVNLCLIVNTQQSFVPNIYSFLAYKHKFSNYKTSFDTGSF